MNNQFLIIIYIVIWFFVETFSKNINNKNLSFAHIKSTVPDDIQTNTVEALIRRTIPRRADEFQVKVDANMYINHQDVFIIQKNHTTTKVYIQGSSGVAVASGFNYYLKFYCNCQIAWQTKQLSLPDYLPNVNIKIKSNDRFHYYQNVCTSSYSFAWWNWTQWEPHIDWMALNGINLPLAFTGQEAIWDRVYRQYFNLTDQEIDEHLTGPAFFAWGRMGNIRGFGGPLTKSWHQMTIQLQKQILKRMRDFGMIPVLPAFAGHVPRAFKRLFPQAKLSLASKWNMFEDKYCCPYLVDPTDPLFKTVETFFLQELINEFGTDHVYNCDPFNEIIPSDGSEIFLSNFGKTIIESMLEVDRHAIWLMQNWFLVHDRIFWTNDRAKAFLTSVPTGQLIVLDLMSEQFPQYNEFENYYGHYYIWCMLHNFGGTLGMFGSVSTINREIFKARNKDGSTMIGVGLTPEGINQNYVVYDFMTDMFWQSNSVNLTEWFTNYTLQRYGKQNEHSVSAWQILKNTIYNYTGIVRLHGKYTINRRPRTNLKPSYWFNICDVLNAWTELIAAGSQLQNSESYAYDLVDVTRESLQIFADELYKQIIRAFKRNDTIKFQKLMKEFLSIFDDLEELLASNHGFLLGVWLELAKNLGLKHDAYSGQFEYNARNQITLWGPNGEIRDYASKQWSGIVQDYFRPRWEMFLMAMNTSMVLGCKFNELFELRKIFEKIEDPFTHSRKVYPTKPIGNTMDIVINIHKKWRISNVKHCSIKSNFQKAGYQHEHVKIMNENEKSTNFYKTTPIVYER